MSSIFSLLQTPLPPRPQLPSQARRWILLVDLLNDAEKVFNCSRWPANLARP